ncbi:TIGR01777 family oxidoreductase [Sporolactobacillus kofuensis]|uniref:TIGR01777 family oxidoreductase n=1 Tax=Sporolactobacillus kofuensis TaxID=269672 RepID=A0ABW1WIQ0_9BACL|nr:TIGR01777 family oxidoreductase [Sporolactobacillus kofuensis]MCO7176973.1 TIGR01777 family oxidoreductase [Sporolactobacillus kofuensis]
MKIVIAGGTGFIGKKLAQFLLQEGHQIVLLTRGVYSNHENITYVRWMTHDAAPEKAITSADYVINLSGTSLSKGRWTKKQRDRIYSSRMNATRELLRLIRTLAQKPAALINASAIGIYPPSATATYSEESTEHADNFLGRVASDWEHAAKEAERLGIRTICLRFGVVLGQNGGALPLMALPVKLFGGGRLGSGTQWVSWIHMNDVVRAIRFVMDHDQIRGAVNVTAPQPVHMDELGRMIATVLHRPYWLPVPSALLKLVLGRKSAMILNGQLVLPQVLTKEGFTFDFPTLKPALENLLINK